MRSLLILSLLFLAKTWSKPSCPPTSILSQDGSKCFYVFPIFTTFGTAEAVCEARSLRFGSIDNVKDNVAVSDAAHKLFKRLGETTKMMWLGGIFDQQKKKLVWINGDNSTYMPTGVKNKVVRSVGYARHNGVGCLEMEVDSGLWFSTDCLTPVPFLCEGDSFDN
ncbi:hypothetical protein L596_022734 [Steinernema carpocapsae]|uniref:C-type lectin domain-containing protein n=1 Tax=Steinernema carpocapsae TaxID=34508 RepID=A0A4U5MML8_STECR|nr:hypothetical protein L596_022734 [Steinernema carpocapsae]